MKIGAQLYTVRAHTQSLADFSETLKKVAEMGFEYVQVSGTGPFEAGWLAEELKKNGLSCPLTHTAQDRIADETLVVAEEHKTFGCGIVGIGMAPGLSDFASFDYGAFRERFLPAALKLKEAGLRLGYHNHHQEFHQMGDGQNMLERLMADFPADALTFILDTYWLQYAGGDPAFWIRKMKGQAHCIHVKDMSIVDSTQRMAVVGEGNMNFEAILAACRDAGSEYLLIEQDDCYGEDPFDCFKRSFNYLKERS